MDAFYTWVIGLLITFITLLMGGFITWLFRMERLVASVKSVILDLKSTIEKSVDPRLSQQNVRIDKHSERFNTITEEFFHIKERLTKIEMVTGHTQDDIKEALETIQRRKDRKDNL